MTSQKRTALLDTAERLFYQQGFHATGIDRIVADAGVVRMTLYNHFPSKGDLVAAVLKDRHTRFLAALDEAMELAADGEVTLALVDAHNRWNRAFSQRGCIQGKAMSEFEAHNADIHQQAVQAKKDVLGRVESALARDGLPDQEALSRRIFLVLEGSNAALPVLGMKAVLEDTRSAIEELIRFVRLKAP
ncbi:TetR/AcrR family transcriptional regulator [Saccharospirillum salsuginis]|uniref:TetR family transcriptional regulator n=1 Tax=Saccharospirillum salsuginis TaxID=418750 RepID=A0A918K772_9GAMM|nr:TetR/AcrR family transcriptional regulator [Saccharospirillum salsuginis]GGX52880.1 TetR family transcriptional regulator [Saccharospirillum salsuginis]